MDPDQTAPRGLLNMLVDEKSRQLLLRLGLIARKPDFIA